MAHGHERVHGFTGLGHGDHEGAFVDDRVAVAELVGELHLRRDAAPVLDGVARHLARVGGGAAGHDDDFVDGAQHGFVDAQLVEDELALFVEASVEGVADGGGLVVDLLFHEGVEAALFRGGDVPFDGERLGFGGVAVEVADLVALGGQGDNLAVVHLHGVAGEFDEAGDVGAEEVFVLADADDQRGVPARCDDAVRVVRVDRQQSESAFEALRGQLHGAGEVAAGFLVVDVQQQGASNLGVGLGEEAVALIDELRLQRRKVLDNAVVDYSQATVADNVRVGIGVGRAAVGGPAGVPDAQFRGRNGVVRDFGFQVCNFAGLLAALDDAVVGNRDTGGVVSAVFEAAQSLDNDIFRVALSGAGAYVSNDSTHGEKFYSSLVVCRKWKTRHGPRVWTAAGSSKRHLAFKPSPCRSSGRRCGTPEQRPGAERSCHRRASGTRAFQRWHRPPRPGAGR